MAHAPRKRANPHDPTTAAFNVPGSLAERLRRPAPMLERSQPRTCTSFRRYRTGSLDDLVSPHQQRPWWAAGPAGRRGWQCAPAGSTGMQPRIALARLGATLPNARSAHHAGGRPPNFRWEGKLYSVTPSGARLPTPLASSPFRRRLGRGPGAALGQSVARRVRSFSGARLAYGRLRAASAPSELH